MSMKTAKLIVGIISMVVFFVIILQSCAAGIGNLLNDSNEMSGTAGFFLAFCVLIAGIIGVSTRNHGKGGPITAAIFYALGGIVGISQVGSFSDLAIWSWMCFIFAFIFFLSVIIKPKKVEPPPSA